MGRCALCSLTGNRRSRQAALNRGAHRGLAGSQKKVAIDKVGAARDAVESGELPVAPASNKVVYQDEKVMFLFVPSWCAR